MNDVDYLDALLRVPRLGTSMASPDGRWIAWTWSGAGATADVYAVAVGRAEQPAQLSVTDESTVLRSWAPDSCAVVVAQDHGGDEHVQLFRIHLDEPGLLQPLTDPSPPYFLRGGQLHPNERWLVYAANFDFETDQQLEPAWVYRHDLESGERRVLARPEQASYCVPQLNDQGTHILYTRGDISRVGTQVWLVDIDGYDDREILNFGDDVKVTASWFPDGQRILFLAEIGGYRRLGVWDLANRRHRWILDDAARQLEAAFVPRGPVGDRAVVVEVRNARSHASILDVANGEEHRIHSEAGDLVPLLAMTDGDWIGQYSSARHPTDLVQFRASVPLPADAPSVTGIWQRMQIVAHDLVAPEDLRWESVDGLPIQGWLYRPRGTARGTIVQVHGGPTAHSEDEFDPKIQYFVAQGFTVLSPNYRGSTGFGLAFEDAVKEDGWGGREQDDIRTGIETLIARGIAQAGKVGITGTSYGGYSSWWAITHWSTDIVAAAAPICGMTDLVVDYYTTRPDLRPYSVEMMGGLPEEIPERYRERSPIRLVHQIRGRLLIVQGMRDPNVTPENVTVVRAALDRAKVTYELLTFADEGHGIRKQDNLRSLYRSLHTFFAEAFEGAAVP